MSPMALLTASEPSTLATSFFMVTKPLFLTILLYSSSLLGVYSSVNLSIFPVVLSRMADESPILAIVNLPFYIRLKRSVDPAYMSHFWAIYRNSSSSCLQTKLNKIRTKSKNKIKPRRDVSDFEC